jgi:hypothetical protein
MGKDPPKFNQRQDPTFDYDAPRKYGIIGFYEGVYYGSIEMWEEEMAKCGLHFDEGATIRIGLTNENASNIAGAISRMRAAGVTTVVLASDGLSCAVLTAEADNQSYYPEYVHQGSGGLDSPGAGGLCGSRTQWRHTIGITSTELPSGRASATSAVSSPGAVNAGSPPRLTVR